MARRASARNLWMGEKMRGGMSLVEASHAYKEMHGGSLGGGDESRHESNPGLGLPRNWEHYAMYAGLAYIGYSLLTGNAGSIPIIGPMLQQVAGGVGLVAGPSPAPAASQKITASRPTGM